MLLYTRNRLCLGSALMLLELHEAKFVTLVMKMHARLQACVQQEPCDSFKCRFYGDSPQEDIHLEEGRLEGKNKICICPTIFYM